MPCVLAVPICTPVDVPLAKPPVALATSWEAAKPVAPLSAPALQPLAVAASEPVNTRPPLAPLTQLATQRVPLGALGTAAGNRPPAKKARKAAACVAILKPRAAKAPLQARLRGGLPDYARVTTWMTTDADVDALVVECARALA